MRVLVCSGDQAGLARFVQASTTMTMFAGPGDGEPELIRPHAEAGIAGLHLRVPQRGRTTAKRRAPARGPRQVIDGRIVVTVEHSRTNAGGVTLEIDSCQAGAVIERIVSDAGDAVGDRDAGQAGAVIERIVPDAGDAVGDRDVGQAGAVSERPVPDAGDAVGDRDAGQAGAVRERLVPDAGDAVGDRDAGQAGAVIERLVPDAGDAVGDRDAGQAELPDIDERGLALVNKTSSDAGDDCCTIVTLVRLVQSANAPSPMLVTLLGIVTLVRLVQPSNA